MTQPTPVEQIEAIAHRIPRIVLHDVQTRMNDWLSQGGKPHDPYMYQQLTYATKWLDKTVG